MKKKGIILTAVVAIIAVLAVVVVVILGKRNTSINASYDQVAKNLTNSGYEVTVVTDAEELKAYSAEGLTAAVIAYQGSEKLEKPDEEKLDGYNMVELFYFETEAQAKNYYETDGYQLGYQAWSDAYYHIGIKNYDYRYTSNIAYAGTRTALDLCK